MKKAINPNYGDILLFLRNTIKLLHEGKRKQSWLEKNPCLDNIRNETRFKKLMEYAKYEWEHFEVPE